MKRLKLSRFLHLNDRTATESKKWISLTAKVLDQAYTKILGQYKNPEFVKCENITEKIYAMFFNTCRIPRSAEEIWEGCSDILEVHSVVLQCSVEISKVRRAILKSCAIVVFRSASQYLKSTHRHFILEGLSDKWEVHIDL